MTRTCKDCSTPITRHSKGRCRPCCLSRLHNDPEINDRRVKRLRRCIMTPEHRAKISAARIRLEQERKNDPEWQAMRRAGGDRLRASYLASPEAQAKRAAATAAAMSRRALHWCPEDRRDDYRKLRRKVGAPEARKIIEAEIPGTVEHARREVANNALKMRLKHEREQREAY